MPTRRQSQSKHAQEAREEEEEEKRLNTAADQYLQQRTTKPVETQPAAPAPAATAATAAATAPATPMVPSQVKSAKGRWSAVRNVVKSTVQMTKYKKGSIKALIGKDSEHLYHPSKNGRIPKRRASIEVDYAELRESSKQLTGAVNFALAAIKEQQASPKKGSSSSANGGADDDGEEGNGEESNGEEKHTDGVTHEKEWDVTGELLKRIGIAGMINVQIALKAWARRSGLKRSLHFSRKLGQRMRRSSTVLSPLAKATLNQAGSVNMTKAAREKIKIRAVRAAAAGDLSKRKSFLKSIALFQSFGGSTLDDIAKALEFVVFIRGDIIIQQGAPGTRLFIIEKGSVDVFVAGPEYKPEDHEPTEPGLPVVGRKVMRLSAGDPFGERAIMQSKPRGASCVAVENTTCFVLHRELFLQAIESIEIFDGFGYEGETIDICL